MTHSILTPFNEEKTFNVYHADGIMSGYGHKKITVEIEYNGEYKKFSATTSYMPGWDAAQELEGQEKYEALYELVESDLEERITEWIIEVDDNEFENQ